MNRAVALALVLAAAVLIIGCGQKRDLILPEAPTETEAPPAPASDRGSRSPSGD